VTGEESGLVETPESRNETRPAEVPEPSPVKKTTRKPRTRKPKPDSGNGNDGGNDGGNGSGPEQSSGPAEAAE
jgi:hypothetical protein